MPLGDAPTGKESVTCKDVFLPQEPMKRRTENQGTEARLRDPFAEETGQKA